MKSDEFLEHAFSYRWRHVTRNFEWLTFIAALLLLAPFTTEAIGIDAKEEA
jgi:hypothetical protein